ncbi:hypothetical protein GCM10023149_18770 [Mucilaginibacter gynuensis]|uniref:Lumazine-binding protein n=1 Tax=Mucilaginibacter gynuensis TaxID=1302236 RepID=A0ABP8G8Y9_9SPHI
MPSCTFKNDASKRSTGTDTVKILSLVFTYDKVIEDMYIKPDTIFIIKTKRAKYNSSWPKYAGKIKIDYWDETPETTKRLQFNNRIDDKPMRYIVTSFSIEHDSSNVTVYAVNQRADYSFKLKKTDSVWTVSHFSYTIE